MSRPASRQFASKPPTATWLYGACLQPVWRLAGHCQAPIRQLPGACMRSGQAPDRFLTGP
eukprot:225059-Lingulodinium_polyedra.AAC.1